MTKDYYFKEDTPYKASTKTLQSDKVFYKPTISIGEYYE